MANFPEHLERQYQLHLKHLKLKGLPPKTIDAYARGMRRIGKYFSYQVDALSEEQLIEYFTDLMASHSWSGVKLDLYGLKFFTEHVLRRQWTMPNFIRPPKVSRLPDIVSVAEAQALFGATRVLSYRVFFFTLYSLGLGLRFSSLERVSAHFVRQTAVALVFDFEASFDVLANIQVLVVVETHVLNREGLECEA